VAHLAAAVCGVGRKATPSAASHHPQVDFLKFSRVLCLYFKRAATMQPRNKNNNQPGKIEVVSFDFCWMPAAVPPLLPRWLRGLWSDLDKQHISTSHALRLLSAFSYSLCYAINATAFPFLLVDC